MWIASWDILQFTETVAKLWTAIDWISTEEAADSLARILWLAWEWIENIDNLWSALVDLWNNFKTDEWAILRFSERIAWAWAIAWLTSSEILWIATAFADVWIEAESWWTAVQKVLLEINNAVNWWWAELERFALLAWKTSKDFAETWKKDAWQWFLDFVNWLSKSWDDAANVLAELIGSDVRLARAFLSVAWAWWQLNKTLEVSQKAFAENIALDE